MTNILAFSRAYQKRYFPLIERYLSSSEIKFYHVVFDIKERIFVESLGGEVVLTIEDEINAQGCAEIFGDQMLIVPVEIFKLIPHPFSLGGSDRYLRQLDARQRLRVVNILYLALEKVFRLKNITHVLNEPVAFLPAHLMMFLARKFGATELFWNASYLPGHFTFLQCLDASEIVTPKRLQYTPQEILRLVADHCQKVEADMGKPLYIPTRQCREGLFKRLWLFLISALKLSRRLGMLFKKVNPANYIYSLSFQQYLWEFDCCLANIVFMYDNFDDIDNNRDVFFPIHLEPEAALHYGAPKYINQVAFAEQIAGAIPDGSTLWIKEHPSQPGALGTSNWKSLRRRVGNVRFLPGSLSSRKVILKCWGTVSIGSTAGMDSLVLGKPTFVFGGAYYSNYPGAFKSESYEDFAIKIRHLLGQKDLVPKAKLREALARDMIKCVSGNPFSGKELYSQKSVAEVAIGIGRFI